MEYFIFFCCYCVSVVISYFAFRYVLKVGTHWRSSEAQLMFILNFIPFLNLSYSFTFLVMQILDNKNITFKHIVNKYFNINK